MIENILIFLTTDCDINTLQLITIFIAGLVIGKFNK